MGVARCNSRAPTSLTSSDITNILHFRQMDMESNIQGVKEWWYEMKEKRGNNFDLI